MERVQRNNQQCLSNNQDEIDEKDMLSRFTLDLKLEILTKLCVKDVAKFMLVSNLWSSIIRTKDFTNMYVARSSTRPRLLFAGYGKGTQLLHSCSQKDPSSDHHSVNITLNCPYQSQLLNGLICCQIDKRLMVGNPSTGQFITLPRVRKAVLEEYVVSFFGYEPVNDQYKVLCMTTPFYAGYLLSRGKSEQHQVLTIGAKQKWRMVTCNLQHRDVKGTCNGRICIKGVVYYLAYVRDMFAIDIVNFDLKSEEFNVIKLPKEIMYFHLVNHNGKVALGDLSTNTFDLWVLEDARKQEWSKTSFLIPPWIDIVWKRQVKFIGTLSTGEIVLAPRASFDPFYVVYYDPKGNNVKEVVIEEIRGQFSHSQVFLDHVENPIFLPSVR